MVKDTRNLRTFPLGGIDNDYNAILKAKVSEVAIGVKI